MRPSHPSPALPIFPGVLCACLALALIPLAPGCGGPSLSESAAKAFDLYDPDRRREGLQELADSRFGGDEPYLVAYRTALGPPPEAPAGDPTVRAAALRALGRHGGAADLPIAIAYLEDDSPFVRWEAARALEHLPGQATGLVRALTTVVIDVDQPSDVRQAAARALARQRNPLAFDALVTTLADSDFAVVHAAQRSLQTLTGQDDLGVEPGEWAAWAQGRRDRLFENAHLYQPLAYPESPSFWDRLTGADEADEPADTPGDPPDAANG